MSHLKERKEKTCLNCNTSLYGRYCHVCGQENLEPKESVWHLVNHFFNDITHFDGKFFSTVKYLITKPGFLSTEYMIGRRVTYLNPVRMYVFTSAFFFLILFSLTNADKIMKLDEQPGTEIKNEGIKDWEKKKEKLELQLKNEKDNSDADDIKDELIILDTKLAAAKKIYGDTSTRKFSKTEAALLLVHASMDSLKKTNAPVGGLADKINTAIARDSLQGNEDGISFLDADKYKTAAAYDSVQKVLPNDKKDGWLKKIFRRKLIVANEGIRKDKKAYFEHFRENFLHSFPKILFFSLPFFALILKLVYIRRKKIYYVDHGIFAIDVYCATFILLLFLILINQLHDITPWHWLHIILGILSFAIWLYMFIYLYKAMRRFYKQGRGKTFLKYIILGFLAFIIDIFLLIIFVVISAISI